jgi:SulP family sulfate permease
VVLDFASTNGLDASVSVSFVKLRQLCATLDADLVLTGLPARSRDLLLKTGTLNLRIHEFATLDAGLEWVEDTLLASDPRALPRGEEDFRAMLAPHFTSCALERLLTLLEVRELDAGQPVFRHGEPGDAMYFVERGRVTVLLRLADGRSFRLRSFGPGTIVGEMAVYTQQVRSADVLAEGPARVRRLTLESLRALEQTDPETAQQIHRFVVKVMASRLALADEALRAAH